MGKRRIFGVAAITAQAKAMRQPIGKGQSVMRVAEADPTAFSPVVVRKSGAWVAPPDVAAVQAETAAAMRRRPKHTAQQLLAEATHLTLSEARRVRRGCARYQRLCLGSRVEDQLYEGQDAWCS